ncbi:hypothetical protein [Lutibacter sp. B1]|uniref:hypothetical protein n=1 Tax=Lutibacter sp. B1 TaxID=2725996 RepID=UPI001456A24E|nr:hypothetical protein [Lutibacter sp. B1]NLP58369.1 hypothetical protein [Lutibacter sp. B1]
MELANIEKLLDKYLNAETTVAEEKELRNYFSEKNVAPHLQEYQMLFNYFSAEKEEKYTKTIHLKSQKSKWKWLSIAASLILMASVYTGYQKNQQVKAEKVYAETLTALGMLSENLNKGNDAIAQLQEFETTTNKIFKQPKK